MSQEQATTTRLPDNPVSIYDRFTNLYDLMFRVNGYGRSLERYLRENPLPLPTGARVLDAGCGTGLLTLALLRAHRRQAAVASIDLSLRSLQTARRAAEKQEGRAARRRAAFAQANALALPFADETFDLVMTSGVLEYLPLGDGLGELSRVLAPGGLLFFVPVRPSPATRLLEIMFRFKAHPPAEVDAGTRRFFRVIEHYHFPPYEPIGWTKSLVLAQKP
ncbi:MAG TPA: class I SAM-dependent methyltransferase [Pyrinomonadaceae bacterium]|jgi:ubiquinone/menaquinone biosynthesis C-methylase UbiE